METPNPHGSNYQANEAPRPPLVGLPLFAVPQQSPAESPLWANTGNMDSLVYAQAELEQKCKEFSNKIGSVHRHITSQQRSMGTKLEDQSRKLAKLEERQAREETQLQVNGLAMKEILAKVGCVEDRIEKLEEVLRQELRDGQLKNKQFSQDILRCQTDLGSSERESKRIQIDMETMKKAVEEQKAEFIEKLKIIEVNITESDRRLHAVSDQLSQKQVNVETEQNEQKSLVQSLKKQLEGLETHKHQIDCFLEQCALTNQQQRKVGTSTGDMKRFKDRLDKIEKEQIDQQRQMNKVFVHVEDSVYTTHKKCVDMMTHAYADLKTDVVNNQCNEERLRDEIAEEAGDCLFDQGNILEPGGQKGEVPFVESAEKEVNRKDKQSLTKEENTNLRGRRDLKKDLEGQVLGGIISNECQGEIRECKLVRGIRIQSSGMSVGRSKTEERQKVDLNTANEPRKECTKGRGVCKEDTQQSEGTAQSPTVLVSGKEERLNLENRLRETDNNHIPEMNMDKHSSDTEAKKHSAQTNIDKNSSDTETKKGTTQTNMDQNSSDTETKKDSAETKMDKNNSDTVAKKDSTETNIDKNSSDPETKKDSIGKNMDKNSSDTETKKDSVETNMDQNSSDTETKKGTTQTNMDQNSSDTETKKDSAETKMDKNKSDTVTKKDSTETNIDKNNSDTETKKGTTQTNMDQISPDTVAKRESIGKNMDKNNSDTVAKKDSTETNIDKNSSDTEVKKDSAEVNIDKSISDTVAKKDSIGKNMDKNSSGTETNRNSVETIGAKNSSDTETEKDSAGVKIAKKSSDTEAETDSVERNMAKSSSDNEAKKDSVETNVNVNSSHTKAQKDSTGTKEANRNSVETNRDKSSSYKEAKQNSAKTNTDKNSSGTEEDKGFAETAAAYNAVVGDACVEHVAANSKVGRGKYSDNSAEDKQDKKVTGSKNDKPQAKSAKPAKGPHDGKQTNPKHVQKKTSKRLNKK